MQFLIGFIISATNDSFKCPRTVIGKICGDVIISPKFEKVRSKIVK